MENKKFTFGSYLFMTFGLFLLMIFMLGILRGSELIVTYVFTNNLYTFLMSTLLMMFGWNYTNIIKTK